MLTERKGPKVVFGTGCFCFIIKENWIPERSADEKAAISPTDREMKLLSD